jgi:hypothetical protein
VRPDSSGEEGTSAVLFVVVERIAFPLMLVAGLAAVASLLWRFGRARREERQQIKWFSYAAALTLSWTFVIDGLPDGAPTFEAATDALGLVVAPSIPIATGLAIFRYRLYDIDRIINRTLVYGLLTLSLAAIYVGGIVVTQGLFRALTGQRRGWPSWPRRWRWPPCSARSGGACRTLSTGASTARSTTRQRRLRPSPPGCATRRTLGPWAGISWGW